MKNNKLDTLQSSIYAHANSFYFLDIKNYYRRIYKDFDMDMHTHDVIEIMYVNFGKMLVTYIDPKNNDNKLRYLFVSTGEYVFIDGGITHKITVFENETQIYNIEFIYSAPTQPLSLSIKMMTANDSNLQHLFSTQDRVFSLTDHSTINNQLLILLQQSELSHKAPNESYRSPLIDFSIAALFSQIAEEYVRENFLNSLVGIKYLRKSTKYITQNYFNQISVKDIAEFAGVSQNYLNKLFQMKYSMSVSEYLNRFKIQKAKLLLEKTNISIKQLPALVGYRSKQNFTQNFVKYTDMTPHRYKEFASRNLLLHWD